MTNNSKQRPIGSGFTAASTADDVLKGIDLSGKHAIVTGGHVGLGLETTRALSAAGASVTVGSRNPSRAAPAVNGFDRVEISQLDLLDPASIDAFVARYLESGRPLHILINNAGIMATPLARDARGYESQFATNHLGHFQLTLGLLPALRAAGAGSAALAAPAVGPAPAVDTAPVAGTVPAAGVVNGARVVNVSSGGHRLSDIRWDDPHFETGYDPLLAYGQSKTANVLFAVDLDRRWAADGIRGYALHPGVVLGTNLGSSMPDDQTRAMLLAMELIDESGRPIIDPEREKKTPQQGASTSVFAATSPLLAEIGGVYLKNNDISRLDEAPKPITFGVEPIVDTDVVPHAIDPHSARRLWELSEQLLDR